MTVDSKVLSLEEMLAEGRLLAADGRVDAARRMLVDATCVAPEDVRPFLALGELMLSVEPGLARRWFRLALDRDPGNTRARCRLAELL